MSSFKVIAKSAIEIVAEFGPFDSMAEAKAEAQDLADMMEQREDLNVYVLDESAQAEMGLEGPVAAHEGAELEQYGPVPHAKTLMTGGNREPYHPDHHYDSDGFKVADVIYDEILDNPGQGPSATGANWHRLSWGWLYDDEANGIAFKVMEKPGPGIPLYTLTALTDNGVFKHKEPYQWKQPEGAFLAAKEWFPAMVGLTVRSYLQLA